MCKISNSNSQNLLRFSRYKVCSKWAPRRCLQTLTRRWKFSMTLSHASRGIAWIAAVIAALRSEMVCLLSAYTLSFRYPHRKKSGGFKSGECGDHSGSHLRLIKRPGKCWCSHSKDSFDVWGVAPSCWNHWMALVTPLRCPSSAQNFLRTSTYRFVLMVTAWPLTSSNQNGPIMPCLEMATYSVHFDEWRGFSRQ